MITENFSTYQSNHSLKSKEIDNDGKQLNLISQITKKNGSNVQ